MACGVNLGKCKPSRITLTDVVSTSPRMGLARSNNRITRRQAAVIHLYKEMKMNDTKDDSDVRNECLQADAG